MWHVLGGLYQRGVRRGTALATRDSVALAALARRAGCRRRLFSALAGHAAKITTSYIRAAPDSVDELAVVKDSLAVYSLGTSIPRQEAMQWSVGFLAVIVIGAAVAGLSRRAIPALVSRRVHRWLFAAADGDRRGSVAVSLDVRRSLLHGERSCFLLLGLGIAGLLRKAWPIELAALALLLVGQSISLRNYYFDPRYDKAELAKAINYVLAHARPRGWDHPGRLE